MEQKKSIEDILEDNTPPYYGSRGSDFKSLIRNLLIKGKLKEKYIDILLSENNMKIFGDAFSTSKVSPDPHNYEFYEQLGDVSAGHFIIYYFYRRFPFLQNSKGVKVIARLKINYGAKKSFADIADKLGFWPYISATEKQRNTLKKKLLEDVFEAFLGAVEFILDNNIRYGVGYAIVYDILSSIFDEITISLYYQQLFDARTRLKEIFDVHKELGVLDYDIEKIDDINYVTAVGVIGGYGKKKNEGGERIVLGKGNAAAKENAEENAAQDAINNLKQKGIYKRINEYYKIIGEIYKKQLNGEDYSELLDFIYKMEKKAIK